MTNLKQLFINLTFVCTLTVANGQIKELPEILIFQSLDQLKSIPIDLDVIDTLKSMNGYIYAGGDSIYVQLRIKDQTKFFKLENTQTANEERVGSSIKLLNNKAFLFIHLGWSGWHSGMMDGGGMENTDTYIIDVSSMKYIFLNTLESETSYRLDPDFTQKDNYLSKGFKDELNIEIADNRLIIFQTNKILYENSKDSINACVLIYRLTDDKLIRTYKYCESISQ